MTLFNNQNPVDSLYHNIHSVYAPLLLKNLKWGINTKMQTLLTELDHGLSKSLRHSIDKNQENISLIVTFNDEYLYWSEEE
ncbi:hypothetical protein LY90DRAFT_663362, partial [Neocallimastix californiae]